MLSSDHNWNPKRAPDHFAPRRDTGCSRNQETALAPGSNGLQYFRAWWPAKRWVDPNHSHLVSSFELLFPPIGDTLKFLEHVGRRS